MRKQIWILFLCFFIINCNKKRYQLANTHWLVKTLTADNPNLLSDAEKNVIIQFSSAPKMQCVFTNSFAFTFVDGKIPDTERYVYNKDTLLFISLNKVVDTNIIIKLNNDTFSSVNLAGIRQLSIKEK